MAYLTEGRSPKLGEGEEYELATDAALTYDLKADAKIIRWRWDCFRKLGFGALHANALSLRRDVDRAEVERLIAAGAAPEVVSMIVL